MASVSAVAQAAGSESGGSTRTPCPYPGCRRVYTDAGALQSHVQDHGIPAESLPGKTLLCSSLGCSGSFPNMQKLMEHMRQHHKPNIFFLCESCRTKLRSYRGLLTHLHTCSKVPRGKTTPVNPNTASISTEPQGPDPASAALQPPSEAAPQPDPAAPPLLQDGARPPSLNADAPDLTDDQRQNEPRSRSPEPASAPHSPPGSSAIWKKNQGMVCNRRVLWEHTKGCYTCVQCGHVASNRKDMTQHITDHHSGHKPAEECDNTTLKL